MATTLKTLTDEEFVAPGRAGCNGCGAVIAARMATKVLGRNTLMANATGCMCVNYGYAGAPKFPFIHTLFENAAAIISGMDAGLRSLHKRDDVNLVVLAGDGGTTDIGLQALSGAVERGHRFLYICYDNEGYMNTGVQRSGATPYGAKTTTTPVGGDRLGEPRPLERRKDMVRLLAAHGIPYAATASIAHPLDYIRKVERAIAIDGSSYIHVLSPCSPGWGFAENMTIKIARLAVETHFFPIYEVEDGRWYRLTIKAERKKAVEEYLRLQGRFSHLFSERYRDEIARIQAEVDANWAYLKQLAALRAG
ncbi:MAG: thiamine pyrophosphate-dependent enzyme [Chloroflexi bacterium]|nr:thiamine pyrophosphate-dependent enzyme [Chloroflexota bacterium]